MEGLGVIFIVGKDPVYLKLISDHLKKYNFNIEEFASGVECLNNLFKNPFIIILDFSLNEIRSSHLSGKEIFKKINGFNPAIKVIMVSNQDSGEIVLELIHAGLRDYIEKDENVFKNLDEIIESYMMA